MAYVLPEFTARQHLVREIPRFAFGSPLKCSCLQGYWPGTEAQGNRLNDISGYNRSGFAVNFNREISVRHKNVFDFADDGYVRLDDGQIWTALNAAQMFTFAIWMRLRFDPGEDAFIFVLDTNFYLGCNSTGHFFFTSDGANFVVADNIDYGDDFWHLHIITSNDTTCNYYIDNDFLEDSQSFPITLAGSHTFDLCPSGSEEPSLSGCQCFGVGFWTRVLSRNERYALFSQPYVMLADYPRNFDGRSSSGRVPDLMPFLPM